MSDPRDAELVEIVASVIERLVLAHVSGNVPEVHAEVQLLREAIAAYQDTLEALRQAVAEHNSYAG